MYFWNYWLRKTWLDQYLKKCVSQDASTDNIGNGKKHCCNLNDSTFTIFITHCGRNYVKKVSFSDIKNPMAVCCHIEYRCQGLSF